MNSNGDQKKLSLQEINLEIAKFRHAEFLEFARFTKEFSSASIKFLMLLNGGALVTLIALVGNMYGKVPGSDAKLPGQFLSAILPAFFPFVVGLVSAACASFSGYINFQAATRSSVRASKLDQLVRGENVTPPSASNFVLQVTSWFGLVAAVISIGAFICGCFLVHKGFLILGRG